MKKLILSLFFFTTGLYAQDVPNLLFANKEQCLDYGGDVNTVATAKDMLGNLHVLGTFSNKADFDPSASTADLTAIGSSDMFLARYDNNGIYIGAIHIGGTGTVTPKAITIDQDFVYIAGNYTKTIDFDPSSNVANLTSISDSGSGFLAIYNLDGILVDFKSLSGTGIIQMAEMKTYNNQLLIVGNFTGTINFDPAASGFELTATATGDSFIAKYNSLLTSIAVFDITSTANVIASTLAVDNAGNIVISGTCSGTTDFDPFGSTSNLTVATNRNTFIAKYSNVGVLQWVKDIGGRQATSSLSTPKLVQDSNNNILITGVYSLTSDFNPSAAIFNLTTSGSNYFLAKYDVDGNYIWAKKIGNGPTVLKRNIAIDTSNNVYIDGTFSGITDFDPNAGVVNLDSTSGNFFFAQYDTNGNFVYANNIVATINTLLINNNNELVVSGTFTGNLDFDPSSATANLISPAVNAFLSKYNAVGSYVYAKQIGNKKSNRIVSYVATDQMGAIYRVGQLSATSDIDPSSAVFTVTNASLGTGFFISKYTGSGALVWGKTITTTVGSSAGISVTNTDPNGNTYVVGGFIGTVDFDPSANTATMVSSSSTVSDLYIAKYDSNGNYLWSKQIIGAIGARRKLVFDALGNFYFSGTYNGTTPIDVDPSVVNVFNLTVNGQLNAYMIKFNPQGDFIWAKSLLAVNSGDFVSVTQFDFKNNSLYVTGRILGGTDFNPSPTETNILTTVIQSSNETFFAKYDLDGNYQMAFKFDNDPVAGFINKSSSFDVDTNGDIYLLSVFVETVDFDPSPTATLMMTAEFNNYNIAVLKLTANGSLLWARQIKPVDDNSFLPVTSIQGNEWLSSAYVNNNQLFVLSSIYGAFDFDPSPTNNFNLNSTIDNDGNYNSTFFVAKYDTINGDLISANKLDGDYKGEIYNSCLDNTDNIILAGSFRGALDFDFTDGVQSIVSSASPYNNDRFWAKYEDTALSLEQNSAVKEYTVYPNPTHSILYVSHESFEEFNVTLMDITGKIIQETSLTNQKGVDVSSFPTGMYFIQIENGLQKSTYKFIKE